MEAQWSVLASNNTWTPSGGNHGFDNEYNSMHALFLGMGAAFKDAYYDETVHQNTQLYELMCGILEIDASPNNGTKGAMDHILNPEFKQMKSEKFQANEIPIGDVHDMGLLCSRCEIQTLYDYFGKFIGDLNSEIIELQNNDELKVKHLPYGVNFDEQYSHSNDGYFQILYQQDFLTVVDVNRQVKSVSFTINSNHKVSDGTATAGINAIKPVFKN